MPLVPRQRASKMLDIDIFIDNALVLKLLAFKLKKTSKNSVFKAPSPFFCKEHWRTMPVKSCQIPAPMFKKTNVQVIQRNFTFHILQYTMYRTKIHLYWLFFTSSLSFQNITTWSHSMKVQALLNPGHEHMYLSRCLYRFKNFST